MLLNRDTAEGIANGDITLVLRRWDAPRAKVGGTQRTVAGTIRIDDIAEHPGSYRVTAKQARAAGYPDAKSAQKELDRPQITRTCGCVQECAAAVALSSKRPISLAARPSSTTCRM